MKYEVFLAELNWIIFLNNEPKFSFKWVENAPWWHDWSLTIAIPFSYNSFKTRRHTFWSLRDRTQFFCRFIRCCIPTYNTIKKQSWIPHTSFTKSTFIAKSKCLDNEKPTYILHHTIMTIDTQLSMDRINDLFTIPIMKFNFKLRNLQLSLTFLFVPSRGRPWMDVTLFI